MSGETEGVHSRQRTCQPLSELEFSIRVLEQNKNQRHAVKRKTMMNLIKQLQLQNRNAPGKIMGGEVCTSIIGVYNIIYISNNSIRGAIIISFFLFFRLFLCSDSQVIFSLPVYLLEWFFIQLTNRLQCIIKINSVLSRLTTTVIQFSLYFVTSNGFSLV